MKLKNWFTLLAVLGVMAFLIALFFGLPQRWLDNWRRQREKIADKREGQALAEFAAIERQWEQEPALRPAMREKLRDFVKMHPNTDAAEMANKLLAQTPGEKELVALKRRQIEAKARKTVEIVQRRMKVARADEEKDRLRHELEQLPRDLPLDLSERISRLKRKMPTREEREARREAEREEREAENERDAWTALRPLRERMRLREDKWGQLRQDLLAFQRKYRNTRAAFEAFQLEREVVRRLAGPTWKNQLTRLAKTATDSKQMRQELLAFCREFAGTTEATLAAQRLRKTPSPLDDLKAANIPPERRFSGAPAELVAVLNIRFSLPDEKNLKEKINQVREKLKKVKKKWAKDPWPSFLGFAADGRTLAVVTDHLFFKLWVFDPKDAAFRESRVKFWEGLEDYRHLLQQTFLIESSPLLDGKSVRILWPEGGQRIKVFPYTEVIDPQSDDTKRKFLKALKEGKKDTVQVDGQLGAAAALSPNGKTLAAFSKRQNFSEESNEIRLFEVKYGSVRRIVGGPVDFYHSLGPRSLISRDSLIFSPDGSLLAANSEGKRSHLFRLANQSQEKNSDSPLAYSLSNSIKVMAFAPDGKELIGAGSTKGGGSALVWDTRNRKKLREWKFPAPVLCVCFSPDGKYVATANQNGFVYVLRR